MDTNRLLDAGERGTHLLFDRNAIAEAFRYDADSLRSMVSARLEDVRTAVEQLLQLSDVERARHFVRSLPPEIRHILVLLYFELLDGRVRARGLLH